MRLSKVDLSAPKYTLLSIRATGLRTSRGSFNINSMSSLSLSLSRSRPSCLKLGLLKLNISEAGPPFLDRPQRPGEDLPFNNSNGIIAKDEVELFMNRQVD